MSSSYDIEDESILSTVFKDAFPDSWRGNAEFAQYLSELSSYGVEKLNREPGRLAEERAQILEQTQDLAFHNYKTFIQTAECSKEIFQDFQVIEKHVDSLLAKLPDLNKECGNFLKEAQDINTSRRMNSMTLQRHTQLLEILEMPQLMDTCVRNAYYEEALELAAHVKRLEKKHPQLPVIVNIVQEVKNSCQLMLNQLIHQLRSNIQLPACLRVIGYLRRMDVFTEAELRIKFLQARDAWFQSILAGIPGDDPYYHITKTIEASRVHLFDIITQYRAIFSDDDPLLMAGKDELPNESGLFHGWVVQKVSEFLSTLEHDLHRGIGGRLDSLLGQCMYFGLSFSRVGADFRGLLAPIFQKAVLQSFVHAINQTNIRFDEAMESYTLLGTLSAVPSSAFALASQAGGSLHPPSLLLEFNPLAMYCNNILTAFNDLRLCAPLSLACDISDQVQLSLMKACECILAYHRAEESTFNPQEADKFANFCHTFADELVPFLNKCLQALFPPSKLAQMLGLHIGELSKMGFVGVMDMPGIIIPIEHLLPAKPEPPEVVEPEVETEEEHDAISEEEHDVESEELDQGTELVKDVIEETHNEHNDVVDQSQSAPNETSDEDVDLTETEVGTISEPDSETDHQNSEDAIHSVDQHSDTDDSDSVHSQASQETQRENTDTSDLNTFNEIEE